MAVSVIACLSANKAASVENPHTNADLFPRKCAIHLSKGPIKPIRNENLEFLMELPGRDWYTI